MTVSSNSLNISAGVPIELFPKRLPHLFEGERGDMVLQFFEHFAILRIDKVRTDAQELAELYIRGTEFLHRFTNNLRQVHTGFLRRKILYEVLLFFCFSAEEKPEVLGYHELPENYPAGEEQPHDAAQVEKNRNHTVNPPFGRSIFQET